ncbi:hypothetical protein L1987_03561 [Smallanthus sonchifolius]|uniref:Uncharacterized protein n=1 Tax=Smallanthus sonchifolius TaxID=185202 RepID=A0ACB9KB03_9ASTR|nr:hypothetical protein L1987_03561 [Smallanthus sonchifolius]
MTASLDSHLASFCACVFYVALKSDVTDWIVGRFFAGVYNDLFWQFREVSVSRRSSKRLASSSVEPVSPSPSEPHITELSDEDVHDLSLIAYVTGTGVKPTVMKKEVIRKPKKFLLLSGREDSLKKPSICRESIYHLATLADREFHHQMTGDKVMKAMVVNVSRLAAIIPGGIDRWATTMGSARSFFLSVTS